MSKYTTEVRFICEQLAGERASHGYMNINSILQTSAPKVFDFEFPLFDEEYRLALECKILRHYYTREISEETVGLWKLRLEDRMNMIMPYYNQLYQSQLLKFNPLYDIDLTTEHKREENSDSIRNEGSESNSENKQDTSYSDIGKQNQTGSNKMNNVTTDDSVSNNDDAFSDTPQGGLDDVKNYKYLTNFRNTKGNTDRNTVSDETNNSKTESNSSTSGSGSSNSTSKNVSNIKASGNVKNLENYIEHVSGKTSSKSYNLLLKEFRENMLNIDSMIVENLSDLFFGLWE